MKKLEHIIDRLINFIVYIFGMMIGVSCLLLGVMFFPDVMMRFDTAYHILDSAHWGDFLMFDNLLVWAMKTILGCIPFMFLLGSLSLGVLIAYKSYHSYYIKKQWCEMFRVALLSTETNKKRR